MVAELRAERTNLVSQLKHIDAALSDSHSVGDHQRLVLRIEKDVHSVMEGAALAVPPSSKHATKMTAKNND